MRMYIGDLSSRKVRGMVQKISCILASASSGTHYSEIPAGFVVCENPEEEKAHSLFQFTEEIPKADVDRLFVRLPTRSNVRITDLARAEQELPKLQRELASLRMEILKLRSENFHLRQRCEKLERESEVNLRMVDEVIARRIGECFADEEERAIEAVLTIQSGVHTIVELRRQMGLSCNDAIELFSRLGRADLVEVGRGKIQLSPQGEEVAQRLLKLDEN